MKCRRRALLIEQRSGSLNHVARALVPGVCDVEVVAAASGLSTRDPTVVDVVLLEMDLPPSWGLRLLETLKQEARWASVPVVILGPPGACEKHVFAVWSKCPDMQVWDTPEGMEAFLRVNLPRLFDFLPPLSGGRGDEASPAEKVP